MAEDLERIVPEEGDETREASSAADDSPPPYQSRFQLLFGVLLGVAMAAVVATVIVLVVGRKAEDPAAASWAQWRPTSSDGLQAVNQIADHVAQRYTLPSGNQLVAVRGGPMEPARLPVTVAIAQAGNYKTLDDKGVLFTLCGLGTSCSNKEGKPTVARSLVLRREALACALFPFRSIKNADQVVAILPRKPGHQ